MAADSQAGSDPLLQPSGRTSSAARVSVIMPCFNAEATIARAITSVQAQTLPDWELVIVDDGSADNSAKIILGIDDARIRLLSQPNSGAAAARNRGLAEAQGEFVAFLDSDDTWHPEFLEQMLKALQASPKGVLAYCGWQNLYPDGSSGEPFVPPDYEPLDRAETFLGGCRWPIHGALVRRVEIEAVGAFDETLKASEDYDLWLRLVPRGTLILVPAVLAYYHHHLGTQITKNRQRVALSHCAAQQNFLRKNPNAASHLGKRRLRELMIGELLRQGYLSYWKRDLHAARALFKKVMRAGYGGPRDWFYMLPAMLPFSIHERLVTWRDSTVQKPKNPPSKPFS